MINKILSLCLFMSIGIFASAQLNVELVAHVDFTQEDKGNGNDIWGYVAPDGTEYAIVGTTMGTLVYSLEDPTAPIERAFIEGSNSTWRDMKQWGEYVYVTCDSGTDGLLIIDMSEAPETINFVFRKPMLPTTNGEVELNRCHNIYIDENGIIYLAGCQGRGADFFDPNVDPWDPPLIGSIVSPYHHDDYAKGDTLYSSRIFEGDLAMYDVSDKTNPVLLGSVNTTSDFTHNAWADPTHTYAFTTDERAEGFVDAYNVSDPTNIEFLDNFQVPGTAGTGTIPHNTHYFNGYLVTSWYTSGLVVIDGNKPDNLVQVAQYDTYDGADGGFSGCWGTTPYLPSGIVLASDINSGLYIFDVDYVRACYLEGNVTDINTGAAINDASITIIDGQYDEEIRTNIIGDYKYGQSENGTFMVEFSHPLYETVTKEAILENGEITILDAELGLKPTYNVTLNVVDKITGEAIPFAPVELVSEGLAYEVTTNENGISEEIIVEGEYNTFAGAWGYENIGFSNTEISNDVTITFELDLTYMDDFALDLGWTVENEELGNFSGSWERAVPIGTIDNGTIYNPNVDVDGDLGSKCYVTENVEGASSFSNDVDNGITTLTSPMMDLTTYTDPTVEFSLWFAAGGGNGTPDDAVEVSVTNGTETILVAAYNNAEGVSEWTEAYVIPLTNEIDITSTMQVIVETSDLPGMGHIVEAGFDQFIVRGAPVSNVPTEFNNLSIYPNPTSEIVQINHEDLIINSINLYNSLGQLVYTQDNIDSKNTTLNVSGLSTGTYVISVDLNDNQRVIETVQVIR